MICTCYEGLVGTCWQYVEKHHSLNIGLLLSIGMLAGMFVYKIVSYLLERRR